MVAECCFRCQSCDRTVHKSELIHRSRQRPFSRRLRRSRLGLMTSAAGILAVIDDPLLDSDIDRIVAAAGVRIVRTGDPSGRRVWTSAAAILVDTAGARRCAERGMPRRDRVLLVCRDTPGPAEWEAAVAVGAQRVVTLLTHDRDLMAVLSDAAEESARGRRARSCRGRPRRPRRSRRVGVRHHAGAGGARITSHRRGSVGRRASTWCSAVRRNRVCGGPISRWPAAG